MIFIDQRGTGFSKPALKCSEVNDFARQSLALPSSRDLDNQAYAIYAKCRQDLTQQGINLGAYNSAQNAADIEALRVVLKYPKVDLYGVSYGSRLALTLMRDYPDGIRSVIIASILPLQADVLAERSLSFNNALNEFFATCTADSKCNANYPNLKDAFEKAYQTLTANPVTLETQDGLSGKKYKLRIDGDVFVNLVYQMLFVATLILPQLPPVIAAAAKGVYDPLANIYGLLILPNFDSVNEGMFYSVQCNEEYSFFDPARLKATAQSLLPALQPDAQRSADDSLAVCQRWNVPKAPANENQAVKSAIPTLLINGKYDPITPPSYGEEAAKTLSNSTVVTLPSAGHDPASYNACGTELRLNFLADPTKPLDKTCVSIMKVKF